MLARLVPGDIFHAEHPNGASLICLLMEVSANAIIARTVTTQYALEFDRRTGMTTDGAGSRIDSITPLPVDIHNVMLGIDRKSRLETHVERFKLTDAEKRALAYVSSHYASHPL
jgi:hypothetical protein